MYKAIREIQKSFDKANLNYSTTQLKENWLIRLNMTGKKGTYEFLFIKSDDSGNDVAVRIFKLEHFSPAARDRGLEAMAELQNKFRYVRFTMDKDGDVTASYDFPVTIEDIGEAAVELLIRFTSILDDCRPVLLRASWD